jgi:hypothetical protein
MIEEDCWTHSLVVVAGLLDYSYSGRLVLAPKFVSLLLVAYNGYRIARYTGSPQATLAKVQTRLD